jgi:hypothetical protein
MNINLKPHTIHCLLKPHTIHCLHYGSAKHPLAEVVPDANWPGMWRVRSPDGGLSDMANLTRAKDAAFLVAQNGPPARDGQRLHWQTASIGEPHRRPLVRSNQSGAAQVYGRQR